MQENQDNRPVNNDEIEIDLVELFAELKKNWKFIIGTTVAFAAAAAIYSFCIVKPVYQYNAMIRIPANIINHGYAVNTSFEILKNDGVANVTNIRGTSLLKLSFTGFSSEEAKSLAEKYIPKAEKRINEIIRGADVIALDNSIANTGVDMGLSNIKVTNVKENKVEVIRQKNGLDIPVSPNKKKNIGIATVLGLFLSSGYIISKFLLNK